MTKNRLSVIIPNYNSPFASKTIKDVLDKSKGDIEVIVNVEQEWPNPIIEDERVRYIHGSSPIGMRAGINKGVSLSTGEYIMKCDDHIMFGEGFDEILKKDCEHNWVQIPRRYALDAENWKIGNEGDPKYPIDYMYIDFPLKGKAHDDGMHGVPWKRPERDHLEIDETPSMQGSCYFMTRNHFDNFLGGLQEQPVEGEIGHGQFSQEAQEIGFKTWLGGGKVMVNKKTWYAHLHKGKTYGRMYKMPGGTVESSNWSAHYWLNNRWDKRVHDFAWFIDEKFSDMPKWPKDWKSQIKEMGWID